VTPAAPRGYTPAIMTWVDGAVLAVLAVSAILAFSRGLVLEVLGVGAWVGAVLAALTLRGAVTPLLEGAAVEPPWLAEALAAAGIFLVVLVVLKLLIGGIARRVQDSVLGGVDRALGLVFGLARGAFLVVLAYILAGMVLPTTDRWPEAVRDSRSVPLAYAGAVWLIDHLPPDLRPRVAVPPLRQAPTQEELERPPARNRT
jgi:membrane protein required for colicin V production